MVSQVQKLKATVSARVGRERPRALTAPAVVHAIEDYLELVKIRALAEREIERCRRTVANYARRIPGAKEKGVTLSIGGAGVDVTFHDKKKGK